MQCLQGCYPCVPPPQPTKPVLSCHCERTVSEPGYRALLHSDHFSQATSQQAAACCQQICPSKERDQNSTRSYILQDTRSVLQRDSMMDLSPSHFNTFHSPPCHLARCAREHWTVASPDWINTS